MKIKRDLSNVSMIALVEAICMRVLTRQKAAATRGLGSQSTGYLNTLLLFLQLLLGCNLCSTLYWTVQERNDVLQTERWKNGG